jgi:hypothetical protein
MARGRKQANGTPIDIELVEAIEGTSTAIEAAADEPRSCGCGCGAVLTSKKARFVVGHDARYKGALLRAYDAGGEDAGRTLVANGWKTEADLAARKEKGIASGASKAEWLSARIGKLEAKRDALNAEIATLVSERDELEKAS